jgi:hypothetical protein
MPRRRRDYGEEQRVIGNPPPEYNIPQIDEGGGLEKIGGLLQLLHGLTQTAGDIYGLQQEEQMSPERLNLLREQVGNVGAERRLRETETELYKPVHERAGEAFKKLQVAAYLANLFGDEKGSFQENLAKVPKGFRQQFGLGDIGLDEERPALPPGEYGPREGQTKKETKKSPYSREQLLGMSGIAGLGGPGF